MVYGDVAKALIAIEPRACKCLVSQGPAHWADEGWAVAGSRKDTSGA